MPLTLIATLGSRGDVQPFALLAQSIAQGNSLLRGPLLSSPPRENGHDVLLAGPDDAAALVASYDVPFAPLGIDFEELTQGKDARLALRGNLLAVRRLQRQTLAVSERAFRRVGELAREADALVYHPKILNGRTIAERNGIPAVESVALPVVAPTRAFPIPMLPFPNWPLTNRATYRLHELGRLPYRQVLRKWKNDYAQRPGTSPSTSSYKLLYAFSPTLVPPPADWPQQVHVTGYWDDIFDKAAYAPPPALADFLAAGEPPVYVGFGSMVPRDPTATADLVLRATEAVGCRVLLGSGWAGLGQDRELPPHALAIGNVPHRWLFPRCRAVVHHGGSGTTHAGLRTGRPTLVCPFFGDQPFWGARVGALGCGPEMLPQKRMTESRLVGKLRELLDTGGYAANAGHVARRIGGERGLDVAVELLER